MAETYVLDKKFATHPLYSLTEDDDNVSDKTGWIIPHLADIVISEYWSNDKLPLHGSDVFMLRRISCMSKIDIEKIGIFLEWFKSLESHEDEITGISPKTKEIIAMICLTYTGAV